MHSLRHGGSGCRAIVLCTALLFGLIGPTQAAGGEADRLNRAAVALSNAGRYEEATALLTRAIQLDPGDGVIRQNLAGVRTRWGHRLQQEGLLDKAQEQYLAALELNPNEASALLGLGDVQLRRRDSRAAAEMYRRAVSVDPRNADAYTRLGDAYHHQGDLEAALSEWERALSLRPQDAGLRQRLELARRETRAQSGYRTRESQHFRVVYEGQRREEMGRELLRILEQAYADVGYELGAYPPQDVEVIFYSDADFERATGVSASAMGGAFYHLYDGKIRLGLRGLNPGDPHLAAVLYHEYTHALVYVITGGNNPPRWVHEGLAVQMERERAPEFKQEAIRQARAGSVPALEASPYTQGSVAMGYLIERYGITAIQQLLRRLGEGRTFAQAFQETFRMDLATFQRTVRDVLARGY